MKKGSFVAVLGSLVLMTGVSVYAAGPDCNAILTTMDELRLSADTMEIEENEVYQLEIVPEEAAQPLGWELDEVDFSDPELLERCDEVPVGTEVKCFDEDGDEESFVVKEADAEHGDNGLKFFVKGKKSGKLTMKVNLTNPTWKKGCTHGHYRELKLECKAETLPQGTKAARAAAQAELLRKAQAEGRRRPNATMNNRGNANGISRNDDVVVWKPGNEVTTDDKQTAEDEKKPEENKPEENKPVVDDNPTQDEVKPKPNPGKPGDTNKPGQNEPGDEGKPGDTEDPGDTEEPGEGEEPDDGNKPDGGNKPDDVNKPGEGEKPDIGDKPSRPGEDNPSNPGENDPNKPGEGGDSGDVGEDDPNKPGTDNPSQPGEGEDPDPDPGEGEDDPKPELKEIDMSACELDATQLAYNGTAQFPALLNVPDEVEVIYPEGGIDAGDYEDQVIKFKVPEGYKPIEDMVVSYRIEPAIAELDYAYDPLTGEIKAVLKNVLEEDIESIDTTVVDATKNTVAAMNNPGYYNVNTRFSIAEDKKHNYVVEETERETYYNVKADKALFNFDFEYEDDAETGQLLLRIYMKDVKLPQLGMTSKLLSAFTLYYDKERLTYDKTEFAEGPGNWEAPLMDMMDRNKVWATFGSKPNNQCGPLPEESFIAVVRFNYKDATDKADLVFTTARMGTDDNPQDICPDLNYGQSPQKDFYYKCGGFSAIVANPSKIHTVEVVTPSDPMDDVVYKGKGDEAAAREYLKEHFDKVFPSTDPDTDPDPGTDPNPGPGTGGQPSIGEGEDELSLNTGSDAANTDANTDVETDNVKAGNTTDSTDAATNTDGMSSDDAVNDEAGTEVGNQTDANVDVKTNSGMGNGIESTQETGTQSGTTEVMSESQSGTGDISASKVDTGNAAQTGAGASDTLKTDNATAGAAENTAAPNITPKPETAPNMGTEAGETAVTGTNLAAE